MYVPFMSCVYGVALSFTFIEDYHTYLDGSPPSFKTPRITVKFGPVSRSRANFSSVRQSACSLEK